ncbi:hypothetical protein RvY_02790 [Ramazzottius varieornatus]|uniref:DUF659 domain-containing protein n=1 Tax=Ramazzottius varieornatus TaxID=947166 RepID=A0A1D1UKX4_RAMVA|nr:hypothetical protein RvY_02790 [Ramazzottius varieornatus]
MTEIFLGITARFTNRKILVRHHIKLSCVSFPSRHTVENIYVLFKQELTNWGIKPQNVSIVQTDNASNMVAAFKMHDANLDQYVTEADELKAIDEAMLQCMMDEDGPPEDDEEAAKTVEAFEKFEVEAGSLFEDYKRYPCFIHTLQLIVKLFKDGAPIKAVMTKAHSRITDSLVEYCNTRADTSYGL